MSVHLVSSIETREFGTETLRVGDLNGDGAPDLLFVQSVYGSREIQCLTATTILGERLWQVGTASADNGRIYSDLPVQVYDWDNDGVNEVLYVRQAEYAEWSGYPQDGHQIRERATRYAGNATMVVLDGKTGREKASFPIPAPADDSFAFADLTGRGRREDFVVKGDTVNRAREPKALSASKGKRWISEDRSLSRPTGGTARPESSARVFRTFR